MGTVCNREARRMIRSSVVLTGPLDYQRRCSSTRK